MSLGKKIFATLLVFISLYAVVSGLILFLGVLPHFYTLEREEASQDLDRLVDQVGLEVKALDALCLDWAAWDDTLQFVTKNDPVQRAEYEKDNLGLLWFKQHRFSLVYILDLNGNVAWGRAYAWRDGDEPQVASPPEFPLTPWPASHPLMQKLETVAGILDTSLGPMMISCHPITDSLMKCAPAGRLVMGRVLDKTTISTICEQGHVVGDLVGASQIEAAGVPEQLVLKAPARFVADSSLLHAYKLLPGLSEEPALLARVQIPRDITNRGRTAVYYAVASTILIAMLAFAVVLTLLRWVVVSPVLKLTSHVTSVTGEKTLGLLDEPDRHDEIGTLTREFNKMVRRIHEDTERRQAAEEALRESEAEVLRGQHLASLGQMGASVAHEIRNPLAAISSAVQVIRDDFDEHDERHGIMTEVLEQVDRLNTIARRLLTYAKTWLPAKQREDVCQLVRGVCLQARDRHEFKDIALIFEEHDKLEAEVDAGLLEQVVWNLMQNAADAMRGAACEVREIRWRFEQAPGAVRLVIADTGPGLPAEIREKVFNPFFTTKTEGTGLGLVVCKNIIEAHGGHILLESQIGRGTQVLMELPKGN